MRTEAERPEEHPEGGVTSFGEDGRVRGGAVVFEDVQFAYPTGLSAIDGLSLEVAAGTTVGIVGPSGCGKSTMLGLVANLHQPARGDVNILPDESGRHLRTMMFQKDTLLPWLTVEQNAGLYYRFQKKVPENSRERVEKLLSLAKIADFRRSYPYELSGGMRRRVAFVATVVPSPQVLLLDEPFSALDEPIRIAIHQGVFEIVRDGGMTTILVTHDLGEAVALCDRVYVLSARPGRVYSYLDVPFGRDRNMLALRETDEYLELYASLWHDLSLQIRKAEATVQE